MSPSSPIDLFNDHKHQALDWAQGTDSVPAPLTLSWAYIWVAFNPPDGPPLGGGGQRDLALNAAVCPWECRMGSPPLGFLLCRGEATPPSARTRRGVREAPGPWRLSHQDLTRQLLMV